MVPAIRLANPLAGAATPLRLTLLLQFVNGVLRNCSPASLVGIATKSKAAEAICSPRSARMRSLSRRVQSLIG